MHSKKAGLALLVVLNSIALLFLTFYFMSLPWLVGDEKVLIWSTSSIKLINRDIPPSDDFALINTSHDLQLIDRYDEYGFPVGNQAITDREKLTTFFKQLNMLGNPPRYVFLDIHFLDNTAYDDVMADELQKIDNLIISAHLSDEGELEKPVFEGVADYGISDYVIGNIFEGVYKYQLYYQDSLKLTPLKMYEDLHQVKTKKRRYNVDFGDFAMPNNFSINYRLLQKDIEDPEAGFNPVNLGELLFLPPESLQEFVGGKIVMLGDFFENDMHETLYEETSGPVILLNAYLTITNKDIYINWAFITLLFVVYAYLSYIAFYRGDFVEMQIRKRTNRDSFARYFAGFAKYIIALSLLSCFTFFIYGIHLNIFLLSMIFYIEDISSNKIYKLVHGD